MAAHLAPRKRTPFHPDDWIEFIGGYPNVMFSMIGHIHQHHAAAVVPTSGHAWWELWTASIADYPHQFRIVELFDEDNGWLMLRGTAADFSTEDDAVAADGRARGAIDWQSGWGKGDGAGEVGDRNVELWMPKPVFNTQVIGAGPIATSNHAP